MQLIMYPSVLADSMKNNEEEEKKNEMLEDMQKKKENLNLALRNIIDEQANCTKGMYKQRISEADAKQNQAGFNDKNELDESLSLSDESIDS